MEGMINRNNRVGRPPLPHRVPSALVLPMPSQLGRQPQLTITTDGIGGDDTMIRPFPEGFGRSIANPLNQYQHSENNPISILPQNQYQHPENNPISSTGLVVSATGSTVGSGVSSFRTESMTKTVSEVRSRQPHPDMNDRKFRRLLSNRICAQKSRLRRINYINELENQAKELEAMIATFSPEVMAYHGKKRLLELENDMMKQKKDMVNEQLKLKKDEAEAHRKEIRHLKKHILLQLQPDGAWMPLSPSEEEDYMTNQDMSQQGWPSQNLGTVSVNPVPEEGMMSEAFQFASEVNVI